MFGDKHIVKAKCKLCEQEFEYEEWERVLGLPPKRNFCGDYTTGTEWPKCNNIKIPQTYRSYISLCRIYGDIWGENIIPYGDNWAKHYNNMIIMFDNDWDEYHK